MTSLGSERGCSACGAREHRASYLGRGCYRAIHFEYRECCRCGSIFVEPMPIKEVLDEIYSPEYLHHNYSTELAGETTSVEFAEELGSTAQRVARLRPHGRLLDVGCGAGRFLAAARDVEMVTEGYEPVGATAEMVSKSSGIVVRTGPFEELSERYDVVHFADVLEHSPTPVHMLAAARALLRRDGLVVARGPLQNQPNLFQAVLRTSRLLRAAVREIPPIDAAPMHVTLFTLSGWHALIERAGFLIVAETLYEVHWPAPERPTASPKSLVKELSLRLSKSQLGRRWRLGDRVVSVLRPASASDRP